MELDILVFVGIALVVGVIIGAVVVGLLMRRYFYSKNIGNLRVDYSTGDNDPYLFLEVTKGNIDKIKKDAFVLLKVLNESYIPQDKQ